MIIKTHNLNQIKLLKTQSNTIKSTKLLIEINQLLMTR